MAHLFRTTSMTSTKKQHQHHNGNGTSPGNGIFHEDSKIYNHKMTNTQQSRRNTMHPRVRDSVLNTGCSDRSSSISDELFLPFPSEIEDHTSLMDTCNIESLMSFDVDERIGEAWPVKCCFVVREIVQTEIAYVQSLGEIIKGYITPLYSYLINSGESPNFIKTVFCNIVKIHQTHIELMEYFQDTCMSPLEFVSSFLKVDFLNLYVVYCTSYAQGNECLERSLADNPELKEFIEQCQRSVGHSLPLSSQLIKPVQRILKYRLLLDELNKHFDSEHPHHKIIVSALDKMSAVAEQINTSFTEPKKMPKAVPSAVAKKRTQQLKDLQKSRSSKGRKSNSPSPLYRCTSESQLNYSHFGSLATGQAMGSSTYSLACNSSTGGANWMGRESSERRPSIDDDSPRSSPSGSLSAAGPTKKNLPNVTVLRSYFEKLEEDNRRQSYSADFRMLKRASSLSDTRGNNDGGESPSPTKPSNPHTRRSSLTLTDFKFPLGNGARKEEKSPSPSEIPISNVEDSIRRHIAEVRAKKLQQIPRTMV